LIKSICIPLNQPFIKNIDIKMIKKKKKKKKKKIKKKHKNKKKKKKKKKKKRKLDTNFPIILIHKELLSIKMEKINGLPKNLFFHFFFFL